jgi:Flp pilus assembly protein TadG
MKKGESMRRQVRLYRPESQRSSRKADAATTRGRTRTRGQALVIVAISLTVLVLFVGLAVDVGNIMARRAKLQSAVDASALSAAQELAGEGLTSTARLRAFQVLRANGVPTSTLNMSRTNVTFPGIKQVRLEAVQRVETYFMRVIPIWQTVEVSAGATADINSYAEIFTKPFGRPGVVSELNLMVWGVNSWRRGGDAYSPSHIDSTTSNPLHVEMPYGYLYRIDVPASYTSDWLYVEIFDPDTFNRTGVPPTFPPTPGPGTPTPTTTADMYASCTNPRPGECTSNDIRANPGMKLNGFPNGRTAFWRVDEHRSAWNSGCEICPTYAPTNATNTQYTIWHFNPRISSAFANPVTLSDYPANCTNNCTYVSRYTINDSQTVATDLSWYRPPGFAVRLRMNGVDQFEREATGGFYFYLYVQGIGGSSENNFDLRVGPPQGAYDCATPCYVNTQYFRSDPDWVDGGAQIFAKRALPLNLDTGTQFPLSMTQVSKHAAGQVLGVRHFDQDCNNGCGSPMQYQMQICGCSNRNDPNCWTNIQQGYVGPNNGWSDTGRPDPEEVQIPIEGTSAYNTIFGVNGSCDSSWLRIQSNPSYSNDTTVWEMPFLRPRLIR